MKWCCPGFEGSFQEAGFRGHSIIVDKNDNNKPMFIMEFRAVDPDVEKTVTANGMISLRMQVYFQYCPWCGQYVYEWYKGCVDELVRPGLGSITK